jgi:hypothetical protein
MGQSQTPGGAMSQFGGLRTCHRNPMDRRGLKTALTSSGDSGTVHGTDGLIANGGGIKGTVAVIADSPA